MSKVVLDISLSLDGFIAQPYDAAGPIHKWFLAKPTLAPRRPEPFAARPGQS